MRNLIIIAGISIVLNIFITFLFEHYEINTWLVLPITMFIFTVGAFTTKETKNGTDG